MKPSLLGLVGLGAVLAGFLLKLAVPALVVYTWIIVGLGGALLVVSLFMDLRGVRSALTSRRGRLSMSATVKISLFGGIILLISALSVGVHYRFDLTSTSKFTLSTQTKQVLAGLNQPVRVINFFSPNVPASISSYARSLLSVYQQYTGRLTVTTVDPELNPDLARQYNIGTYGAEYGVTVFKGKDGERLVYGPQISVEAEYAFTSAILEVTGVRQQKVAFLVGQGEDDIYTSYDAARKALEGGLFRVGELNLLQNPSIPGDVSVLVIAGPRKPLSARDSNILRRYLKNGGRLLMLLDPGTPKSYGSILEDWGLVFENGTIIDPKSYVVPNKSTPLVPRTRNHFGFPETYFPDAAALVPVRHPPRNLKIAPLVWTSPESWLQVNAKLAADPVGPTKSDVQGSLAIGALVSFSRTGNSGFSAGHGARLAVIGDSDFASNTHFQDGNNGDLFIATVTWLAQGKPIISINRKVLPTRRLILSPEEARFLQFSSIGLFPILLIVAAGLLWWRRSR